MAQTFQCFLEQVLRGLTFDYNYIDDLLVTNEDSEEHKITIHMVVKCLQEHRISINLSKCKLGIRNCNSQGIKLIARACAH